MILVALVTIACLTATLFATVGCANDKGDDTVGDNGDNGDNGANNGGGETENGGNDGENTGGGNTENNGGVATVKPLLGNQDCGHTLNRYGFCGECQLGISRVTVDIGKDITIEYHIVINDVDLLKGRNLQVVINDGDHVEILDDMDTEEHGFVYRYHGVAPHQMSHRVDAALIISEGGKLTVIDDLLNYTVKQNLQELINAHKDDAEIVQIISDILRYGAAAQIHQNYETDDLATDGIKGLAPARTEEPEKSDLTLSKVEGVEGKSYFRGATVWFGSTTRLKITVKSDDISKVTMSVNGNLTIGADKFIAGEDGTYYYYTDDIGMAHFGDVYTFVIYDDSVMVETLTYSVNSYVYSKITSTSSDEKLVDLVLALYRAGLSAAGWVAGHPAQTSIID